MSDQKKKHLHGGHRERLKRQFLERGAYGFHEHQILELLLFYAIPQKDTNPLAHVLLERFGSLLNVLKASREELISVSGVGGHTADFLQQFSCFAINTLEETFDPEIRYDCFQRTGDFLLAHHQKHEGHLVTVLLLNNRYELISHETVAACSIHSAQLHPDEIVRLVLDKNASMVIVAHSHPGQIVVETQEDKMITELLAERFELLNIIFLEHYLIVGHRYTGLLPQELFENTAGAVKDFHHPEQSAGAALHADTLLSPRKGDECAGVNTASNTKSSTEMQEQITVHDALAQLLSYAYAGHLDRATQAASRLLSAYDDNLQVICAEPMEKLSALCESDHAATLLKMVLPAYGAACLYDHHVAAALKAEDIANWFVYRYMGVMHETVLLLLLDGKMNKIELVCVAEGSVNAANFNIRRLTEMAYNRGACYAVLAHNHPLGVAMPSSADVQATELLMKTFAMVNCRLLEHFVVAGSYYMPILLRTFREEHLKTVPPDFYSDRMRSVALGYDKNPAST